MSSVLYTKINLQPIEELIILIKYEYNKNQKFACEICIQCNPNFFIIFIL